MTGLGVGAAGGGLCLTTALVSHFRREPPDHHEFAFEQYGLMS